MARKRMRFRSLLTSQNSTVLEADFPMESRLAEYMLAFFELDQLGRMLLEIIFSILPTDTTMQLSEHFRAENGFDRLTENLNEAEDGDDYARAFLSIIGSPFSKNARQFVRFVTPLLKQLIEKDRVSYRKRTEQLCRKLCLDADDMVLLELGCCYQLSTELENLIDTFNVAKKTSLFSHLTGLPRSRVSHLISSKGKLVSNELLTVESRNLQVDDSIFNYLVGSAGRDFASDAFKSVKRAELAFSDFDLKSIQKETMSGILCSRAPANLLFYGKPGTGKTELARTLANQCDIEAVVVNYGADGDARDRKTALLSTVNSVPEDTLVIVDEVDGLLNTQSFFRTASVNKGWLNQFMDNNRHKMIWIVNESGGIEESVRRRFSYSLHFKALSWRQRSNIWNRQLRKHRVKRFFPEEKIQILSKRFAVSPGLIAYAVKTIKQCRTAEMDAGQIHAMLNEVLTRQMELTEGRKPEQKLNGINENYDLDALNTDTDIPRLLQGLENFQSSENGYGLNLLFWGWPGTGKTEFGKYMADRLGKELLVKRMSDLQSMWVGQTEKQIAAAFREAEENDAVLFIDEADSVFINRQTANRSWETSQTNEILTQMENFSGILICCTNLLENLDEAAMRRFAFKIKFLPLTTEGKLRLYRKYFQALEGVLSTEVEARISKIRNLCLGDIKAVWQRLQMLGRLESLPHTEVVSELEKEVSYKRGGNKMAMGFGAWE